MTRTVITAVFLAGCYNPSIPAGHYRCGAGNLCPDGLLCIDGWCGGTSTAQDMATEQDMMPTPPDMAQDCGMCLSGKCVPLSNGVMGCRFAANKPISAQCRMGWQQPIAGNPFPGDAECLRTNTGPLDKWLGYHRAWGTGSNAATPPVTLWWNGQPTMGASYRWISICGTGGDSGWGNNAGYTRAIRCNSGVTEPTSPIKCPRGATPGDADWDMVTTADETIGVLCVRR